MSSVVISGDTSGSITLQAPSVAGSNTLTLPALTGTVQIGGPAFSYYQSSAQTGIANGTFTKLTFTSSDYDNTSGMYASSKFTPTVAGYYQLVFAVNPSLAGLITIYKNGVRYKDGSCAATNATGTTSVGSIIAYANGSSDYFEVYYIQYQGSPAQTYANSFGTYFQGIYLRGA
jgi:hypothetical protein